MNMVVWLAVLLLVIAHQDFWFWNDARDVFGIPVGLAYHVILSIVTSIVWGLVCFFAWPKELDLIADQGTADGDVDDV